MCGTIRNAFLINDYSSKPFFYNISGMNFNLEEVKHGLLRGNKKNPTAYMRSLGWNDVRATIIKEVFSQFIYSLAK